MAKRSRTRKTYTSEQRRQILDAANREGLTANDVKKKFGVTPVTYYSWRKKSGVTAAPRRGRPPGRSSTNGDLHSQLRTEVRSKIQQILPEIVRTEVSQYMDSVFGARRRGRRRG